MMIIVLLTSVVVVKAKVIVNNSEISYDINFMIMSTAEAK